MRFTVFTPTYNRAHTLPALYASLCPVRIITTANGGKHRAINAGVHVARGELFFIVDSDDQLPDDSLAVLDAVGRSIPANQRARFAGVCGLKGYPDGRPIGTTFDGDLLDITTLQRGSHGISGDKAEVVYTDVMRAYPFPEFPGERFLPESVVWDRIAHDGKKLRFFNDIVYTADYSEDGLTRNYRAVLHENPRGHALYLRQRHRFAGVPAQLAIGQCLLYFDDHQDDLPITEICRNLGISLAQLRGWLFLRRLRQLFPSGKARRT